MKKWKIPVTWEVCGIIECEAPTLEEAMEYAEDKDGVIPLPTDSDYIDGSWRFLSIKPKLKWYVRAGITVRKMKKRRRQNDYQPPRHRIHL